MFEQVLRVIVAMLVIATFLWYSLELSARHARGYSFPRVALSFGSMLVNLAILAYIVTPNIDAYLQMGMEAALVIGATLMATGVVAMPIVKWRQRRKRSV